jgi:hypothetical protein
LQVGRDVRESENVCFHAKLNISQINTEGKS